MRGRKRLSGVPDEVKKAPRRQREGQEGNKSSRSRSHSYGRNLLMEQNVGAHVVSEWDARKVVLRPYVYTLHPTKGYRRKRLRINYA